MYAQIVKHNLFPSCSSSDIVTSFTKLFCMKLDTEIGQFSTMKNTLLKSSMNFLRQS